MKALRSFTVRPRLPVPLAPLQELAWNLRWTWDDRVQHLFRWVDPRLWDLSGHDPVRLLAMIERDRLEQLATDDAFLTFLGELRDDLRHFLEGSLWFQRRRSHLRSVAYFSPEFGLSEALPQYSGGLGVLAGDHLKAASGLGVPLVGVGLFYRQGYFSQQLSPDGWQQETYVTLDPFAMPLAACEGVQVKVDMAGETLVARVWEARVGRVSLFLLDSDCDENRGPLVTDRLYGGDIEHRLRQEMLLGIGGVRALAQLGEAPQVFHTNEGHAGFLGLERIRCAIQENGLSFPEAVEAVRAGTVFTTHTPVPAGIDRFPRPLMERYFKPWADECGVDFERLMALGHQPDDAPDAPFNMAVMGLRLSAASNGVSRLHGKVSRRMFGGLWPGIPVEEVPITSITNGVHSSTWVAPEMRDALERHVLPEWAEAGPDRWARIEDAPDEELWQVRERCRERLVSFVRHRLRRSALARGFDASWCDDAFDPGILTIGFARRFAAYKRATLLLSQPERLSALLLSADRPVQLVFAGKAHPADDLGKEMIRQIFQFSQQPHVRHRVAFIEDYDIAVARMLYQGCDVWLNNPRRPLEACGTSGEKAALNGGLNCSILDGWWDELFDGTNGWAISSAEAYDDLAQRDAAETASLFGVLERQVVPLFYERGSGRIPTRWVRMMKASLRSLGPVVPAARMVRDYVEQLYEPAAHRTAAMQESGHARARALAGWKEWVGANWDGVRVQDVDGDATTAELGGTRRVVTRVALGSLSPDDVQVQLVHGPVGDGGELVAPSIVTMHPVGTDGDGRHRYEGSFGCERAGRYGFTVRVVPSHYDLATFAELGRIAWA